MTTLELEARAEILARRLRAAGHYVTEVDLRTDSAGAAAVLGIAEGTLRNWRAQGCHPLKAHRPGAKATYFITDLIHFIDSSQLDSVA